LQINFAALYWSRITGRRTKRVLRGGAWNNQPHNLSCAIRNRNEPDNRNNNIGLRCAKTPLGNVPKDKEPSQALGFLKPAAHGLPECGTVGVHRAGPVFRLGGTEHKIARLRLVVPSSRNERRGRAFSILVNVIL